MALFFSKQPQIIITVNLYFLVPTLRETTNTLAASLHAVSQAGSQGSVSGVRYPGTMMMIPEAIRPTTPLTTAMTASGQLQVNSAEGK